MIEISVEDFENKYVSRSAYDDLLARAETAEARVKELVEEALKKAAEILEIWECEGTLGEGGEELAKIVRDALKGEK